MLGALRNIRQAQFDILRPPGDGHHLQELREKGDFEAAGITSDGVPDDILRAMTSGRARRLRRRLQPARADIPAHQ